MSYNFKSKFDVLYEKFMSKKTVVLEDDQIRANLDQVVIDPKQLKKNKEEIINRKSPSFYSQLELLANKGVILTVTAIKRVNRPSGNLVDATSHTFQEEADVVQQYAPGNYHTPMSLPLTILKKVEDYNGSFNIPVPGQKPRGSVEEYDDSYNKGKQPKGTRTKGGNN